MKAKGYFRQNCLANYDYPMPFAVRSIGCTTMKAGEADIISGALRHPSLEISWTISGCGEIIHYGQPFEMRRNDVFLFLPDETHHYRVKSREWHWRWLCLDGPLAAAMLLACRLPRKISCDSGFPEALFRRIEENISTDSPGMLAELSGTAWQIIARLIGSHHPGFHKDIYEECMDYIRNRYQEPELGIDFLAEHVGVTGQRLHPECPHDECRRSAVRNRLADRRDRPPLRLPQSGFLHPALHPPGALFPRRVPPQTAQRRNFGVTRGRLRGRAPSSPAHSRAETRGNRWERGFR